MDAINATPFLSYPSPHGSDTSYSTEIAPQLFCNRLGPTKWKKYVFKIINPLFCLGEFENTLTLCERKISFPSLYVGLTCVLIAHIFRSIVCIQMPIPWYPLVDLWNLIASNASPAAGTPPIIMCSTGQIIFGFVEAPYFFLIASSLIGSILLSPIFCTAPCDEDYENYLFKTIRPLLEENQFELAYTKIFLRTDNLNSMTYRARDRLGKMFIEKLVKTAFFEMEIIDQLVVTGITNKLVKQDCYEISIRKMYSYNHNLNLIFLFLSSMPRERRKILLQEYAHTQLTRTSDEYANFIHSVTQLPKKDLAHLVTTYLDKADITLKWMGITTYYSRYKDDFNKVFDVFEGVVMQFDEKRQKTIESIQRQHHGGPDYFFNNPEICAALREVSLNQSA